MKQAAPPAWLQRVLRLLLSVRDRDTVVGDLYEEFREAKLPQLGPAKATLWYAQQVLSFLPRRFASACARPGALLSLCVFSGLAGAWLGAMEIYLQRPGYAGREVFPAIIVGQALVTVLALRVRSLKSLKPLAMAGCLVIAGLGGSALFTNLRGPHFEGYALLISLALLLQALLTICTLPAAGSRRELNA